MDYSKIKAGDVLRLVGPAGERVEFSLEEVAESGTFLINDATITGLDTFVNGIQYATTILSAFDPTGLASIQYVDKQDAKKLDLAGGTNSKMTGNLYMGGNFIAGVGEPTAGDHAATKSYADGKVAKEGNNAVERNWRINHDNKNFIFFHDEGHLQLHHLAEPNLPHEAATKTYADGKLSKTGGTMTGGIKFSNGIIDANTSNTNLSGRAGLEVRAHQDHSIAFTSGSGYKEMISFWGYDGSDKDDKRRKNATIGADGSAKFSNLTIWKNGEYSKKVATEEYVNDAISGIEMPQVQTPLWKKVGSTSDFAKGTVCITVYDGNSEIWLDAHTVNGFEYAHKPYSSSFSIRWPISIFQDKDGKREYCFTGSARSIEFKERGTSVWFKIKASSSDDTIIRDRHLFDGEEVGVIFPPII